MLLYIHLNGYHESGRGSRNVQLWSGGQVVRTGSMCTVSGENEVARPVVLISSWVCWIRHTNIRFHVTRITFRHQEKKKTKHTAMLTASPPPPPPPQDQMVPCKNSHHRERLSHSACSLKKSQKAETETLQSVLMMSSHERDVDGHDDGGITTRAPA